MFHVIKLVGPIDIFPSNTGQAVWFCPHTDPHLHCCPKVRHSRRLLAEKVFLLHWSTLLYCIKHSAVTASDILLPCWTCTMHTAKSLSGSRRLSRIQPLSASRFHSLPISRSLPSGTLIFSNGPPFYSWRVFAHTVLHVCIVPLPFLIFMMSSWMWSP